MMTYKIEVTETQLKIISAGMELLARLGIGQFEDALNFLPLDYSCIKNWPNDIESMRNIISKYTIDHVDGYNSNLGIYNNKTSEQAKIAWDMYQVFRHQLYLDAAIKEGIIESKNSECKLPEIFTVDSNPPMAVSDHPLTKILDVNLTFDI